MQTSLPPFDSALEATPRDRASMIAGSVLLVAVPAVILSGVVFGATTVARLLRRIRRDR